MCRGNEEASMHVGKLDKSPLWHDWQALNVAPGQKRTYPRTIEVVR